MRIGEILVNDGVLLAPMEDVTNLPFRVMCKRKGADIVYTEFISSDGLVREAARSVSKLQLADEERPAAIQIFGGDVGTMVEAAQRAVESNPNFLDINYGCWVKNVVVRNAGAALLKDPQQMQRLTRAVVDAVNVPVTVKTRLGWSKTEIVILDVARRIQDAGAAAITVHCRTRDMGHDGAADWTWIPRIKEVIQIPVILNGDVKTAHDVCTAFKQTGADAVMIGRAAIGNPFIFTEAKRALQNDLMSGHAQPSASARERVDACIEHLKLEFQFKPSKRAIHEFRKHYSGYLRGLPNNSLTRQDIVRMDSFDKIEERLYRFVNELEAIGAS
ncbi:MAG: tRNA dihydrouridine synthase DusB [Ignavibacteria bacterium]|nr:tRNA dihydrouridine synthase DusB [Ignavibacteria bacterium]